MAFPTTIITWVLLLLVLYLAPIYASTELGSVVESPTRSDRVVRQAGGRRILSGALSAGSQAVKHFGSLNAAHIDGGKDATTGHVGAIHSGWPSGSLKISQVRNPPVIFGARFPHGNPCSRERFDRWGRPVSRYYQYQTYDRRGRPCPNIRYPSYHRRG